MKKYLTPFFFLMMLTASAQIDSLLKEAAPICGMKPVQSSSIVFRCRATNSEKKPLIVVDGVVTEISDFKNINPDDIQSIAILKDAHAATLFCSRASNGIIVITTKSANRRSFIIIDETDGTPLAGATVKMFWKKDSVMVCSDKDGGVVVDEMPKERDISVCVGRVGYEEKRLQIRWALSRNIPSVKLKRKNNNLEEVVVTTFSTRCLRCGIRCICRIDKYSMHGGTTVQHKAMHTTAYPNPAPAGSLLQIKSDREPISAIQLLNSAGQIVHIFQSGGKENPLQYQLPQITSGIYFIRILSTSHQPPQTHKLLIQ
jgi:TonB-dependent SusC/RagA subfamily outer membrane receptor